nr:MAG TPA: hypothetical protein [Caudoviricetes sp.]
MLGIDIYKNGVHMAVVQSYQSRKLSDGVTYRIKLLHAYQTLEAIKAGWHFGNDDGKGLDLVIEKPYGHIEYLHCEVISCRWPCNDGCWLEVYLDTVCRKETRNE